jgi:hypothetical protein
LGSAALAAEEQKPPATANAAPTAGNGRETAVKVVKRIPICKSDKTNWFPNVHRMANGNLVVTCQTAPDETAPEATEVGRRFLSVDNGETWRQMEGRIDTGGPCKITLRDGTFLQLWFYSVRRGAGWVTKVVRSTDNGLTYTTTDNVPVHIDNVKEGVKGTGLVFDGGLEEMDNGDLLATMYGYFEGDQKYRCVLVKSSDRGQTWRYVSTIAYDAGAPGEGFCEPAMVRTGPTGLLVLMRTGSEPGKTPMYQTLSADAGLTWSTPTVAADRGVEPDLVVTQGKMLVCSYGRADVYVMLSPDGQGREWTGNLCVFQGGSTCYTGMVTLGPDRIFLVHDALKHTEKGDDKPYDYVFGVVLQVQ